MAHGGKRTGAGRPKGTTTRKTREIAEAVAANGLTPLEYMINMMRDEANTSDVRFEAAKAAAPYIHPRLAAVEHGGSLNITHEDAIEDLG